MFFSLPCPKSVPSTVSLPTLNHGNSLFSLPHLPHIQSYWLFHRSDTFLPTLLLPLVTATIISCQNEGNSLLARLSVVFMSHSVKATVLTMTYKALHNLAPLRYLSDAPHLLAPFSPALPFLDHSLQASTISTWHWLFPRMAFLLISAWLIPSPPSSLCSM